VPPKGVSRSPPYKTLSHAEATAQLQRRPGVAKSGRRSASQPEGLRQPAMSIGPAAVHKFHTGQTVMLVSNRYGANHQKRFKVVQLLPEEHGLNHYRLKSVIDGHERIATENELI
jgi:hypothetical protein